MSRSQKRPVPEDVPRIALVDYANKELSDALRCGREIGSRLWGIRIDTCGENYMEGMGPDKPRAKGVSVEGVCTVRKALDDAFLHKVNICLSSGFADPARVRAFVNAEKDLGMKLFDMLGAGEVFYSRVATGDIIEVEGEDIHKVGRLHRPNNRLERMM